MKQQIIGLVRFSYPALSGFTVKPDDMDRLERDLYSAARLEARFHLFERLTIPSLAAQTDGDFTLGVLVGQDFPKWARDRLEATLAPLRDARVIPLAPLHHYPATQRAFARMLSDDITHLTSFRLDDDDAMDRDHVARLRRWSHGLQGLLGQQASFCMGSNRGYFLSLDPNGNEIFDVVEKLPLGIGLAMTSPVETRENIFRRNHRLLPQFYTTFTEAETPAFIRTVHAGNDSSAHVSGQSRQCGQDEIARDVPIHFPFTLGGLMAL